MGRFLGWMAILLLVGNTVKSFAAESGKSEETADGSTATTPPSAEPYGADWVRIGRQALGFLVLEHGFRYLTEEGTRHPHIPFFRGFVNSLNNLHGWADGDPFLVSYVGHPMQGAVAGYIFAQNDREFLSVEFGKNKPYWKSRLRAAAFSWAYSEQFEIGPMSEASIGNTQAFFPQQGFADQVATPVIGLAWMIAEDSLDRFVVKRLEARTANPFVCLLVRGGLNPSRSLANVMAGQPPWHRTDRSGPSKRNGDRIFSAEKPRSASDLPPSPITKFEFMATARTEYYLGPDARGACIGGGGAAAFRMTPNWQFVADVSGCKLTRFGDNLSGDSLTYTIGPRWTANPLRRWTTYSQLLIGGRTLTHEEFYPARKVQLEALAGQNGASLDFPDHARYTRIAEHTGLTVSVRGGVGVKLSPAIQLQVADLAYAYSWHGKLDGTAYTHALQFSGGLVLRIGTW